MDDRTYVISLADGTLLENLKMNGNNFVSKTPIDASVFTGNCSTIIIDDGIHQETRSNVELVQLTNVDDEFWFVLRELTARELEQIKMQSDIEYVAMMTGVEM